jgi:hypothetical protein
MILNKPIKLRYLLPVIYIILVIFSWIMVFGMKQAANTYPIIGLSLFIIIFSHLLLIRFIPHIGLWIIDIIYSHEGSNSSIALLVYLGCYFVPIIILFMTGYLLDKLYEIRNTKKS